MNRDASPERVVERVIQLRIATEWKGGICKRHACHVKKMGYGYMFELAHPYKRQTFRLNDYPTKAATKHAAMIAWRDEQQRRGRILNMYRVWDGKYVEMQTQSAATFFFDLRNLDKVVSRGPWYSGCAGKYIINSKDTDIYLHRFILDYDGPLFVDHVDRDTTNNTEENLRIASPSANAMNCNLSKNNSSGYNGISVGRNYYTVRWKEDGRWRNRRFPFSDLGLEAALEFRNVIYTEIGNLNGCEVLHNIRKPINV